jgi:hypothetical protein
MHRPADCLERRARPGPRTLNACRPCERSEDDQNQRARRRDLSRSVTRAPGRGVLNGRRQ